MSASKGSHSAADESENAPITQPKKLSKPRGSSTSSSLSSSSSSSSLANADAKASLDGGFEGSSRAIVQTSTYLLAQGRPLLRCELPSSLSAAPATSLPPHTLPLPQHSLLAALTCAALPSQSAHARVLALPTDAGVWVCGARFAAGDAPPGAGALPLLWRQHRVRKGSGPGSGQGQDALESMALPLVPIAAAEILGTYYPAPSPADTAAGAGAGAGAGSEEGQVWCAPISAHPQCTVAVEAALAAQLAEADLDDSLQDATAVGPAAAQAAAAAASSVKSLTGAGLPLLPFAAAAIATTVAEAAAAEAAATGDAAAQARAAALAEAVVALRLAQSEAREVARERAKYEEHMKRLHEYNDVRDVGQALLGAIAQNRGGGTTVKDLYAEFGLDPDD